MASYPEVGTVIEIDLYDEMFHRILGKKWLEYPFPERAQREQAMMDAALLRGFLFTLSVAEGERRDPTALLIEATAPKTAREQTPRHSPPRLTPHIVVRPADGLPAPGGDQVVHEAPVVLRFDGSERGGDELEEILERRACH